MNNYYKPGSQKSEIQRLLMPQNQKFGTASVIFGLLCRFIIALAGAFGVCVMLADAFRLTGETVNYVAILLKCLLVCAVVAGWKICQGISKTLSYISLGTVVVCVIVFAAVNGFAATFAYAPVSLWNYLLNVLIRSGYTQLSYFQLWMSVCNPITEAGIAYAMLAYDAFIGIIGFIFTAFLMRRVRVLPIIISAGLVMTVVFTYNIITENFGFVSLISSAFGILVLKCYDSFYSPSNRKSREKTARKVTSGDETGLADNFSEPDTRTEEERFMDTYGIKYCKKKEKHTRKKSSKNKSVKGQKEKLKLTNEQRRENLRFSASAGIAGLVASLIIFGAAVYPASVTNDPWNKIPGIDTFMTAAREFVYDYISGNNASKNLDAKYIYTGPRSTEPTPRKYSDKVMLSVESNSTLTLYLRSWTGDTYNSDEGAWYSGGIPDTADIAPEELTELFYLIVDYTANNIPSRTSADRNSSGKGIISTYVNITNVGIKGDMLYLPSRYSRTYGIMKYNSDFEEFGIVAYHDYGNTGMIITGEKSGKKSTNEDIKYSTVAHLPYYTTSSFLSTNKNDFLVYNIVLPHFKAYLDGTATAPDIIAACEASAAASGATLSRNCIIYRLDELTAGELSELRVLVPECEQYNDAALSYYLEIPENEREYLTEDALAAIGSETGLSGNPDFAEIYSASVSVMRWIAEQASYTLSPRGYEEGLPTVYQFLHTAKTGYCVQYATSAVMLLRSLGIPARYVEGYMASSFKNAEEGTDLRYTADIIDKNAHSWIEIYIDGYGWLTMEATEPFITELYGSGEITDPGDVTGAPVTVVVPGGDPVGTDVPETTEAEETGDVTTEEITEPGELPVWLIRTLVITTAVFILLCTALYTFMRAFKKRDEKRREELHKVREHTADGLVPDVFMAKYSSYVFRIFGIVGLKRGGSELLTDFAIRADAVFTEQSFAPVANALMKDAYGHIATPSDCAELAAYALYLNLHAAEQLNGAEKFFYHSILKLV